MRYKPHFLSGLLHAFLEYVEVREDSLYLHRGLINTHEETIPYSKITNVGFEKGCLGTTLGFGAVLVETAGSPAAEMILNGYSPALRDAILEKITQRES
jgi:membrane protein YdbS with pleckstrin-like domain